MEWIFKSRIATVMKHGSPENETGEERILAFLAALYSPPVRLRAHLFRKGILRSRRLPCRVVSIGNLTVGGTGKTPMTLFLADHIRRMDRRVGILSRGYGGRAEKTGGLVSDGESVFMNARDAGDEPFLMANRLKGVPVAVGRDRYASGMRMIERFRPDVLLLDDGFQHLRLFRDVDIVLLDTFCPFGNTHVLPRGLLREPMSALNRADVIVLTRANAVKDQVRRQAVEEVRRVAPGRPIFTASHVPTVRGIRETGAQGKTVRPGPMMDPAATCMARRVFAFSGIAANEQFKRVVCSLPCERVEFEGFPDHHPYSMADIEGIRKRSIVAGADLILTTEKDYARFGDGVDWPVPLVVFGVEFRMEDERGFQSFVEQKLVSGSEGE